MILLKVTRRIPDGIHISDLQVEGEAINGVTATANPGRFTNLRFTSAIYAHDHRDV
jgi:hypothetical protein